MKRLPCSDVQPLLDEHARGELDPARAREVSSHLDSCAACAARSAGSRAALGAVRAFAAEDSYPGLDEALLQGARLRALAAVRQELEAHPRRGWLLAPAWGLAAALVLALAVGLVGGGPAPRPLAALPPGGLAPAPGADDDVSLVTVVTGEGVTLEWQGEGSYLVIKSRRPSPEAGGEVTLVCGRKWTDRGGEPGPVFYRVVRAPEPCRT